MSVIYKGKMLLNPCEKGKKAFYELQEGVHYTNEGKVKVNKQNKPIRLSDTKRAYRSGYLAAQKDSRRAYKSRQNRNNGIPVIYINN